MLGSRMLEVVPLPGTMALRPSQRLKGRPVRRSPPPCISWVPIQAGDTAIPTLWGVIGIVMIILTSKMRKQAQRGSLTYPSSHSSGTSLPPRGEGQSCGEGAIVQGSRPVGSMCKPPQCASADGSKELRGCPAEWTLAGGCRVAAKIHGAETAKQTGQEGGQRADIPGAEKPQQRGCWTGGGRSGDRSFKHSPKAKPELQGPIPPPKVSSPQNI